MFDFRERRSHRTAWLVFLLGLLIGAPAGEWFGERAAGEQARQAARLARAQLAAAVCADAFMDQKAPHAALTRLAGVEWERRADLLSKEGWATMPDRTEPEASVARLCAARLGEAYTRVRQTLPIAR
jgi:hypothetical protein